MRSQCAEEFQAFIPIMVVGLTSSYILVPLKFVGELLQLLFMSCHFFFFLFPCLLTPVFEGVIIELPCQQIEEMKKIVHSAGLRCGSLTLKYIMLLVKEPTHQKPM